MVQGHRGFRGLYPENTIQGFIEAVQLGVQVLEMDVVVSQDHQVVVSHEAWMNHEICTQPDGRSIIANAEKNYNLYHMPYAKIKAFDCGKIGHPHFPLQKKMLAYKPLLREVLATVEQYLENNHLAAISYNVEIKTEPGEIMFNPEPITFIDLVYQEILHAELKDKINIQSFDITILQAMKQKDHEMRIGLLIENNDSLSINLERLGFIPDVYSPEYCLVDRTLVKQVREKKMKLMPWTVNETKEMEKLIALNVDGIITDYPDRLIKLLKT